MAFDRSFFLLVTSFLLLSLSAISCKNDSAPSEGTDDSGNTSTLSGRVTNSSGDGIADITLQIRNYDRTDAVTATTGTDGDWSYDGELPVAITPNGPARQFDPPLYRSVDTPGNDIDFTASPFENRAAQDNLLIGACYYPWYDTDRHWQEGYSGDPILGEYSSTDRDVNEIHIGLATRYGIDFFVASWWGEGSFEDNAIQHGLLTAANVDQIKFAILYETRMLGTNGSGQIDMDDSHTRQALIDDFEYLAEKYFGQPQYLKIDGKPVVYIYLSRIFAGDYAGAVRELRNAISEMGFELYLIGDQVYWQDPDTQAERSLMRSFDGVSAYNMHSSVENIDDDFVSKVLDKYSDWIEVTGSEKVDFIPGVIPGFDDTQVRPEAGHPEIEKNTELFRSYLEGVQSQLSSQNMIILTSWNEWHENTQIEPGLEYGTNYLDVLEQSLGDVP